MTRQQHSLILPAGILIIIAAGFLLGALFPSLPASFYLICAVVGGIIILAIDMLAKRNLTEPLHDERLQGIAELSSWVTFRIAMVVAFVVGFLFIYAFPSVEGLKLVGIGAVCTVAFQGLVFGIVSAVIRRTR